MQTLDELIDSTDNERIELVVEPNTENPEWNQDKLERLIKSLMTIVDSMNREPSFFSKAATFWASIPWWLQLIALVVLVAPPLALGIVFAIPALIVISATVFILYCAFSLLFFNHNQHQAGNSDLIKEQIIQLANALDMELQLLGNQAKDIVRETTLFRSTNNKLAQKIDTLEEQLNQITEQASRLKTTTHDLDEGNVALGNTVAQCDEVNEAHAEKLQVYQHIMHQLKLDHRENTNRWSETICELNQAISELDSELQQQMKLSQQFKKSVEQMKHIVITDEKDQVLFQEKLEGLFSKKIDTAHALRQRIEQANRERLILEEAIANCNLQCEQIIKREEVTLTRMEADYGLSSVGFFASEEKVVVSEKEFQTIETLGI